jgi:Acetyl-CoA acetyltransferase
LNINVVATGHTKFGKDERNIGDIMMDACNQALTEIPLPDIDAIYVANFSSSFGNQCHLPSLLASKLGIHKEITRVESACASGGLALKEATVALRSGLYNNILVVGVEKMTGVPSRDINGIIARAAAPDEITHGTTFPGLYALMAKRHFFEYGTTEEHLAKIAVKNHENALNNPNAQFHKKISVDEVLASTYIASPLKKYDCSPVSDGAAAIVLSSQKNAQKYTDSPIKLIGIGHDVGSIELYTRKDITRMPAVINAAKSAFDMANVTATDIDVAELHDCFTITELIEMEDIGFCDKGKGKQLIDDGATEIDGSIPVNPSGGLKAKGHPLGATGVSQVVEIVKQLQSEAKERQVPAADVGLCCNVGGSGGTAIVSIFSR